MPAALGKSRLLKTASMGWKHIVEAVNLVLIAPPRRAIPALDDNSDIFVFVYNLCTAEPDRLLRLPERNPYS